MKELALLSEKRTFTKDEAKNIVQSITDCEAPVLPKDILAYMTGYSIITHTKTAEQVADEMQQRERKHKKAVKYAKKTKTEAPEMDLSPIEMTYDEYVNHPFGRNAKEDFYPSMSLYLSFNKMIEELQVYQVFNVALRGSELKKPDLQKQEKDERALISKFDPVYRNQGHVVRAWREIQVDYQLAGNNVIFNEVLKDYANFFAYLTIFQKLSNRLLSQEPRLHKLYKEIMKPFDTKAKLFSIALEEALTLCAGSTSKHSGVPTSLVEAKKIFWDTFKESTIEAKDLIK